MVSAVFPDLGQNARETLMRLRQIRIDRERGLIVPARRGEIACLVQQVGVADMRHRVAGMTSHRLAIRIARGRHETAGVRQRPQFGQRAAMHRIGLQDLR